MNAPNFTDETAQGVKIKQPIFSGIKCELQTMLPTGNDGLIESGKSAARAFGEAIFAQDKKNCTNQKPCNG